MNSTSQMERLLNASHRSHAFIFECPDVSEAFSNALIYAQSLNCLKNLRQPPCGDCESCSKIEASNHPDVYVLEKHGKSKQVSMDTIRKELLPKLANLPHEGKTRVIIIRDCSQLVGPTNHALLKTLEEPPTRTIFILCTASRRTLLPTILSRCQFYKFSRTDQTLTDVNENPKHAKVFAAFQSSRAGKSSAIEFVDSLSALKDEVPTVLLNMAKHFHLTIQSSSSPNAIDAKSLATILKFRKRIANHNAHVTTALMAMMAELKELN